MATMQQLVFTSDGEWDVIIPIMDNSPVEITEYFEVRLTTDSQRVELLNNITIVEIIDDDSMSLFLCIIVHSMWCNHCRNHTALVLMLEDPEDAFESNETAEVCVSVVNGFLQSGLEVVITLDTSPFDPEGHDQTRNTSSVMVCIYIILCIYDTFEQHITLLLS